MRITIEPTGDQRNFEVQNHGVTITHPSDDLVLDEVIELLAAAVRAYGFHVGNLYHEPETTNEQDQ